MVTCLPLSYESWKPGCLVRTLRRGRPDGEGGWGGQVTFLTDLLVWSLGVTLLYGWVLLKRERVREGV